MSASDTSPPATTTTTSPNITNATSAATPIANGTQPTPLPDTTPATTVLSPTTTTISVTTTATGKVATTAESASSEGFDIALIGAIVGGVVVVIIIVVIIIVCVRRRWASNKDKDSDDDDDDDDDESQPQPLPKLDAFGRVVNGAGPEDTGVHAEPEDRGQVAHMPLVYEDPALPSTQVRVGRESDKNLYGNIPARYESSAGSYVVPLDYRPSGSTASEPEGGHQNGAFDWKKDEAQAQAPGEEAYMPMGPCSPLAPRAGQGRAGVGGLQARPSPCLPKKGHGYVNAPSQPASPPAQTSWRHQKYQAEEEEHYYGNVDAMDVVGKVAGQPRLSPKPVLRVSPMPSPKQFQETSFNSSPAASPKLPHRAGRPPGKAALPSAGTDSPELSSKAPPAPPTRLRLPCADTDSDSGGENYVNMQEPDEDYMNAPPKKRDYVNAPPKKAP